MSIQNSIPEFALGSEETHKYSNQDRRCPDGDSNLPLAEYNSKVLPAESDCSTGRVV
jgi:hypothetical protein